MANAKDEKHGEAPQGAAAEKKPGLIGKIIGGAKRAVGKLLAPKIALSLVVASIAVHAAVYWYTSHGHEGENSHEIAIGKFEFQSHFPDGSLANGIRVSEATFQLHVNLTANVEKKARELMHLRERKLRQDIEELIRQSRDREFADPQLVEIKRRLREQIDHTLGLKAVEEVLITDLRIRVKNDGGKPSESSSEESLAGGGHENTGPLDHGHAQDAHGSPPLEPQAQPHHDGQPAHDHDPHK